MFLVCRFLLFCCLREVFLTSLTRLSLEALAAARLSSQASATVMMAVSEALRSTDAVPAAFVLFTLIFVESSIRGTVGEMDMLLKSFCYDEFKRCYNLSLYACMLTRPVMLVSISAQSS